MTRYLLFPYPQHGHVLPMAALAAELVRRGEQVSVLITPEFADQFREVGCEVTEFSGAVGNATVPESSARTSRLARLVTGRHRQLRAVLVERVRRCWPSWRPDFVVTDYVAGWGVAAARAGGVPFASLSVTYALNDEVVLHELRNRAGSLVTWCARRVGLTRLHPALRMPGATADLVLVNVVPELQPLRWSFDERFRFVGPLRRESSVGYGGEDLPWERIERGPTVYVSTGTVFTRGVEYFRKVAEAFRGSRWCVVMATSHTDPGELGVLPENVVARRYVPQSRVLGCASVFVTHAGMNSAMEGLSLGIPMVLVPRAGDQLVTAQRLRELGAGVSLDPDASASAFRDAVERVYADESIAAVLAKYSEVAGEAGGPGAAADVLQQAALSRTRSPHPVARVHPSAPRPAGE